MMAKENFTQAARTAIAEKQLPARTAIYEYVLDTFEEQQAQLFELTNCLLRAVEPENPKDPEDGANLTAWRIAQVMYEMLSTTALQTGARNMLMGEAA